MAAGNVGMDNLKADMREIVGQPRSGAKCSATIGMSYVVSIALFIIGCIGAAGAFPGSAIGWVTVGLAAGGFAFNLAAGGLAKRKIELIAGGIMAAVFIAIGALGGAGILTAQQVGYGVLATVFVAVAVNCIVTQIKKRQTKQEVDDLMRRGAPQILQMWRQKFIDQLGVQHTQMIDRVIENNKRDIENLHNLNVNQQKEFFQRLIVEMTEGVLENE